LRLLEVEYRLNLTQTHVIFLTALTHAAIAACLTKLVQLVDRHRQIPNLECSWLDRVRIEHVLKGNDHAPPPVEVGVISIYAGTIYQVMNPTSVPNATAHLECGHDNTAL
jgi:hypothetical protein